MFSVAPETTANAPVRAEPPRFSERDDRSQQGDFAALVDVKAPASNDNPRPAPADRRDASPRNDLPARPDHDSRRDAPASDTSSRSDSRNLDADRPAANRQSQTDSTGRSAKHGKTTKAGVEDANNAPNSPASADAGIAPGALALGVTPDPTAVAIPAVIATTDPTTTTPTTTGAASAGPLTIAAAAIAASAQAAVSGDDTTPMVEAVTAAANEMTATNFTIAKTMATTPAMAVKPPADTEAQLESSPQLASVVASAAPDAALTAIKTAATAHRNDAAKPAADLSGDPAAAPQAPQSGNAAITAHPVTPNAGGAAANPVADDGAASDASALATTPAGHHSSTANAQPQAPQPDPGSQIASSMPQPQTLPSTTAVIPAAQLTATAATNLAVPISGLAIQIATSAQGGRSRFEIRLDPAELGRIDVRLDIDRHGQVTSHLTVEKPETLAMLRQDAPQLQRALEDAGLKTGNNGLQFSLSDQSSSGNHNGNGDDANRQPHRLIISDANTVAAVTAGKTYAHAAGASRGIDIRV